MKVTTTAAPQWYLVIFTRDGARLAAVTASAPVFLSLDGDGELAPSPAPDPSFASLMVDGTTLWLHAVAGASQPTVNGEAPGGPRLLTDGDVVALDGRTLAVTRRPAATRRGRVTGMAEIIARLRHETERSLRYATPLTVMVLRLAAPPGEEAAAVCEAGAAATRNVDLVAYSGSTELVFVFPETGDQAMVPAARVLGALESLGVAASAGLAGCPHDGSTAEALLHGARTASEAAGHGSARWIHDLDTSIALDGRAIVAVDPSIRSLLERARALAHSTVPVLLQGETGAGKEVVARLVHEWSPRRAGPFVTLNCGAIPETLLEAELFGYERGAFTGASTARAGLYESAAGGTLLLDEVGEGSSRMQVELLRVLDTGRVRRVGSTEERPADVRLIAATNRDLAAEVEAGRFRRDLFFRLNAATLHLPPLRERPLDLPLMARSFLAEVCERQGRAAPAFAEDAMRRLLLHDWPGNVRELRNLVEYLAAVVSAPTIEAGQLPERIGARAAPWLTRPRPAVGSASHDPPPRALRNIAEEVAELERTRMAQALEAAGGVQVHAAALIGMPLRTFVTKLRRHGLGGTRSKAGR